MKKLIWQFRNWIQDILKPISILICLVVILLMINIGKSKHINTLEKKLYNQELCIEEMYNKTSYKHVDSLYMEIMNIGHQLDSMQLKYDYDYEW